MRLTWRWVYVTPGVRSRIRVRRGRLWLWLYLLLRYRSAIWFGLRSGWNRASLQADGWIFESFIWDGARMYILWPPRRDAC